MNQVAFITGGSRGIGLGIARKLASQKINLAINGVRDENAVMDTIHELKSQGVDVLYCQGNVALAKDRADMIDKINSHFGQLNFLINNAGIAPRERKDVLQTSEASFDEVLDTNLKSTYFMTQSIANWMIDQKELNPNFNAAIINISSISSVVASVNRGEYCISKAGISMTTQLFAVRLGEYNIPVYEVRPGIIETDMTSGVKEKYDKMISEGLTIQKRWGSPEDVGKCVSAIIKGDFPYSTGQVFYIDGGLMIDRL